MKSVLRRRSLVNLVTLVVMWFSVLAPTLSHAIPSNVIYGKAYIVICTVTGTKLVKIDSTESQTNKGAQLHNEGSCLSCAFHASSAPPPSTEFYPEFTQNISESHQQWGLAFSPTGLKWSQAAARAPPNLL